MTIVSQTFDELLEELEFEACVRYDMSIPAEQQELWISDYLNSLRREIGFGMSIKFGIGELLYNAYSWGNGCDKNLPISVKVFKGSRDIF